MKTFTDGELLTAKSLNDVLIQCREEAIAGTPLANYVNTGGTIGGFPANGLIGEKVRIECGTVFGSANSTQYGNLYWPVISFRQPFQNGPLAIFVQRLVGSMSGFSAGDSASPFRVDSVTKSGFRPFTTGTNTAGYHAFAWFAIGA